MRLQNHMKGMENSKENAFNFTELLLQLVNEEKKIAGLNEQKESENYREMRNIENEEHSSDNENLGNTELNLNKLANQISADMKDVKHPSTKSNFYEKLMKQKRQIDTNKQVEEKRRETEEEFKKVMTKGKRLGAQKKQELSKEETKVLLEETISKIMAHTNKEKKLKKQEFQMRMHNMISKTY